MAVPRVWFAVALSRPPANRVVWSLGASGSSDALATHRTRVVTADARDFSE